MKISQTQIYVPAHAIAYPCLGKLRIYSNICVPMTIIDISRAARH